MVATNYQMAFKYSKSDANGNNLTKLSNNKHKNNIDTILFHNTWTLLSQDKHSCAMCVF